MNKPTTGELEQFQIDLNQAYVAYINGQIDNAQFDYLKNGLNNAADRLRKGMLREGSEDERATS